MSSKKAEMNVVVFVTVIFLAVISSTYLIGNITGNFGWLDRNLSVDSELQSCLESCSEMYSSLLMILPNSEEYTQKLSEISLRSKECLALNEQRENPLEEEKILESCGYVEGNIGLPRDDCVPSGETIYLEEDESCREGIQKCCSGIGLCGKNQLSVPDHVACLPY